MAMATPSVVVTLSAAPTLRLRAYWTTFCEAFDGDRLLAHWARPGQAKEMT
jgi:hypothetical protein